MLRIIGLVALTAGYYWFTNNYDLVSIISANAPSLKGYEALCILVGYTVMVAAVVSGGSSRATITNKVDLSALDAKDIDAINKKLEQLRMSGVSGTADELKGHIESIRTVFASARAAAAMEVDTKPLEFKAKGL